MSSQLGEPGGCSGFSMNQGLTRVTLLFKVDVTMFPASSPQGPFISFFIVLFFSLLRSRLPCKVQGPLFQIGGE